MLLSHLQTYHKFLKVKHNKQNLNRINFQTSYYLLLSHIKKIGITSCFLKFFLSDRQMAHSVLPNKKGEPSQNQKSHF